MAMATKKVSPASGPPPRRQERAASPALFDRFTRLVDAAYRFLASLKLAVISLATLAATLAYATFFESWYGAGLRSSRSTARQALRSCWRSWG